VRLRRIHRQLPTLFIREYSIRVDLVLEAPPQRFAGSLGLFLTGEWP
jgi:hypothetical protein